MDITLILHYMYKLTIKLLKNDISIYNKKIVKIF